MNKKILGYNLKIAYEAYRKVAFDIAKDSNQDTPWNKSIGWEFSVDSRNAERLKEAGILDLWFEPVFEQGEYKVGSWVICQGKGYNDDDEFIGRIKTYKNNGKFAWVNNHSISKGYYTTTKGYENICVDNLIKRLATQQEIQKHLVDLAKTKGFVNGARFKTAYITNDDRTKYTYFAPTDDYHFQIWARIEGYSDSGTFTLKVSKEGVYFEPEDAWLNIRDLKAAIAGTSVASDNNGDKGYTFTPTRIDAGCKKNCLVSDWKKVLDTYDKLNS